jgi:hypothetical protein
MNTYNTYAEAKKEITVENFSYQNLKKWVKDYSHKELVELTVYSTELVIHLCSSDGDAQKKVIQAAKDWSSNPSEENRQKCKDAADAADAVYAAYAYAADAADEDESVKEKIINYILSKYDQTETPEEKEAFDVMAQDNEAVEAKAVAEYSKINPKNGEWWLCDRGGVEVVFLRHEDSWRGDTNDSYEFCNVKPLCEMVAAPTEQPKPKHTKEKYVKVEFEHEWELFKMHSEGVKFYVFDNAPTVQDYSPIFDNLTSLLVASSGDLYRKALTELTEREAFIEVCMASADLRKRDGAVDVYGQLFDAGCRFSNSN